MFRRKALIMNLTPLLDLIIILFFAQNIQLSERAQRIEDDADNLREEYTVLETENISKDDMLENLERNLVLNELEISRLGAMNENADRMKTELLELLAEIESKNAVIEKLNETTAVQEIELNKRAAELELSKEEIIEREKAYIDAFARLIDPEMFVEIVKLYLEKENIAELDENSREETTVRLARYFVEQKKQSEAFKNHLTVWSFYLHLDTASETYEVKLRIDGIEHPLKPGTWDFSSVEKLKDRLNRELRDPKIPNPSQLVIPIWWTVGDVYYSGREMFREALRNSLLELNAEYREPRSLGGRGLSELEIISRDVYFGGNVVDYKKNKN